MNAFLLAVAASLAAAAPKQLGAFGPGEAGTCGKKPNCVSTLDERKGRRAEPWTYAGSREEAQKRLEQLIARASRADVVDFRPGYLHAEFRTALWRFVDDVEFFLPKGENVIHYRSASRLGQSDFGVNRRRMKKLAKRFAAAP